jgi:hypothetical protein
MNYNPWVHLHDRIGYHCLFIPIGDCKYWSHRYEMYKLVSLGCGLNIARRAALNFTRLPKWVWAAILGC